jgi:hypothetical protein
MKKDYYTFVKRISTLTVSVWLNLPGVITPADIAHGFMETRKAPHHDTVQSRGSMIDKKYLKEKRLIL